MRFFGETQFTPAQLFECNFRRKKTKNLELAGTTYSFNKMKRCCVLLTGFVVPWHSLAVPYSISVVSNVATRPAQYPSNRHCATFCSIVELNTITSKRKRAHEHTSSDF